MLINRTLLAALMAAFVFMAASDTSLAISNTITTLSTYASDSSMTLDASGNPVIAYRDSLDTQLRVLHCDDPFCTGSGESLVTVPPVQQSGWYPSIALDSFGNPVVSYYTTPFDRIKLLHCDDPNCIGSESITTPDPQAYLLNHSTSVAIDATGNPVIVFALSSGLNEIRVIHCNDPNCAGDDESITIHDSFAAAPSLALDAAGNPVVAYYRSSSQSLRVMHCNDPDCTGGDESTTAPATGITPSLQLDALGNPVIAYYTGTLTRDLRVMHCNDANCAGSNESVTTPDSTGDVGSQPSLALGGGNPVVSYRDADNGDLKLLFCNDPNCTPDNNTVVSLDVALDSGENSSVVVDGSGLPTIAYDAGTDLRLLRCAEPNCVESVGGIAELPDASVAPLETSHPSRLPWAFVVGIAAAACLLVLGGAAGYAKRHELD